MKLRWNSTVWPNGEFSLWRETYRGLEPLPKYPDALGFSLLPNSHKLLLGLIDRLPKEREKRGVNGISRYGARMIRNAAFLMEKQAGKKHMSFLTVTLPGTPQLTTAAAKEWGEITRQFLQALRRLLISAGLPGEVVGCTEIQPKRFEREGGMPLHLHLVFQGRAFGAPWSIGVEQFTGLWMRAVRNRVPGYREQKISFASATNVQRVKQSAEGYLGKYMSKAGPYLQGVKEKHPECIENLPSSWWFCSKSLKDFVKSQMGGGGERALKLYRQLEKDEGIFDYAKEIYIEMPDGNSIPVAIVGKLSTVGLVNHGYHHRVKVACDLRANELESRRLYLRETRERFNPASS